MVRDSRRRIREGIERVGPSLILDASTTWMQPLASNGLASNDFFPALTIQCLALIPSTLCANLQL